MTKILLCGMDNDVTSALEMRLKELGNETATAATSEVMDLYEDFLPDMVLMEVTDSEWAVGEINSIIEFDATACIFALGQDVNTDVMYKSGVRVILNSPAEGMDAFVDLLYGACNDLEHENCIGCWKTNRFANLQKL